MIIIIIVIKITGNFYLIRNKTNEIYSKHCFYIKVITTMMALTNRMIDYGFIWMTEILLFLFVKRGSPCSVVVNVLDCDLIVSEFKLQSCC